VLLEWYCSGNSPLTYTLGVSQDGHRIDYRAATVSRQPNGSWCYEIHLYRYPIIGSEPTRAYAMDLVEKGIASRGLPPSVAQQYDIHDWDAALRELLLLQGSH
jgi:hypothetical protein